MRTWRAALVAGVAAALVGASPSWARAAEIAWKSSLQRGLAEAGRSRTLVMVDLYTEW